MDYQCSLRDQAAQPTLTIRRRMPAQGIPGFMGQAFGTIAGYLGELKQEPAGQVFAAYYSMDMNDMDVEAGFTVKQPLPGRGEIIAGALPAGKTAFCLHHGPYDKLGAAYEALTAFMREQGLVPSGVAYEFYLDDPSVTHGDPHTEIVFPVKT